ncbi:hypothetical protein BC938DRAFT_480309 [Jimgerdemannia flammicorona]|uniref:SAP domain-containing protein n=1 Tax=Jimgerdemannia flammicorona TaxID=994334 RepID=A0A433QJ63_9FUNG|nr:hypothetical protein BC938DRAFT_480309 [Jimgerdemannia flammicorona]
MKGRPPQPSSTTSREMDNYAKLKVPELKAKCRELGLLVGGTKQVLITRLQDHHAKNNQQGSDSASATSNASGPPLSQASVPNVQQTVAGLVQALASAASESSISGNIDPEAGTSVVSLSQITSIQPKVSNLSNEPTDPRVSGIDATANIAPNPRKKKAGKSADNMTAKTSKRSKKEQSTPISTATNQDTSTALARAETTNSLSTTLVSASPRQMSAISNTADPKPRKRKAKDADGESKIVKKKEAKRNSEESTPCPSVDPSMVASVYEVKGGGVHDFYVAKDTAVPAGFQATKAKTAAPPTPKKRKPRDPKAKEIGSGKRRKVAPLVVGAGSVVGVGVLAASHNQTLVARTIGTSATTPATTKRGKINLAIRPVTGGPLGPISAGTPSFATPSHTKDNVSERFATVAPKSQVQRVPQMASTSRERGLKVKLAIRPPPGSVTIVGSGLLTPTAHDSVTPGLGLTPKKGHVPRMSAQPQKRAFVPLSPVTSLTTMVVDSVAKSPLPASQLERDLVSKSDRILVPLTRPKLGLRIVKCPPYIPVSITTSASVPDLPILSPPLTTTTLLHSHFIGRLYTSLHVHHPHASPPPVDDRHGTVCGIHVRAFDDRESAAVAVRFWAARFYDVVCGGCWEIEVEGGMGRRADVLAGLEDVIEVEKVGGGVWMVGVKGRDGVQNVKEGGTRNVFVVGCTGEVIGWDDDTSGAADQHEQRKPDLPTKESPKPPRTWRSLRPDWRDYIVHHLSITVTSTNEDDDTLPLLAHIHPTSYISFMTTHPHLIHTSIHASPPRLALAARFVLRNLVPLECFSGPGQVAKGLRFDVPAAQCLYVESVVVPGEAVRGGRGRLALEIGYVQTTERGFYVLVETGQIVGEEEEGVREILSAGIKFH